MLLRFFKSEDGNYSLIFAIALVPIMSAVAGVTDYVGTTNGAAKLQQSLDATALAIATKYHSGMTDAEVDKVGSDFFSANINSLGLSFDPDSQSPISSVKDNVVGFDASAQKSGQDINISATARLLHTGFIAVPNDWQALRTSYVRFRPGQPACALALDDHASASVKIQGSTQVALNGCVIASNSDAIDSVYRGGSASLAAKCVTTVGATSGLSNSYTKLTCGMSLERQYPSLDPLDGVSPPTPGSCMSMSNGKTKTLSPGTYCNKTWTGNITLNPGTYILQGGGIKLNGGDSITGVGVTIFLLGDAVFTTNGNQLLNLSPATIGPYAGITIYQEKADTNQLTINGTSDSKVLGFVYAPGAPVAYTGNSGTSGTGDCIRLIADTLELNGNSTMASDCDAQLGGRQMFAGRIILLVK
jgi:hypothetical protein